MQSEDLLSRLTAAEDNLVERKPQGSNRAELRRTLVAFANSTPKGQSAVLFLGVHDKGMILGVDNPDALQKTIGDVCRTDCYPPIEFSSRAINIEAKVVVAVIVPASSQRPHFAGQAFVRRGSESVTASAEQYEELMLSRNDKCREILSWRDQVITVMSVQHRLGQAKRVADQAYRQMAECRVLSCDAHVVRLEDIANTTRIAEPLESVTIMRDEERWRPMLVVKGI
jgi:hypothetical protein